MRLLNKFIPKSIDPIRAIEWVIAVFTFIGGLYLFTPLYASSVAANGLSTMAQTLSHPYMILFWGALLLAGALAVMIGLYKYNPKIKSVGWFAIILARFFQLLTTFIVAGFFPISWIYPMTVTAVVIVLWGLTRVEVRNRV